MVQCLLRQFQGKFCRKGKKSPTHLCRFNPSLYPIGYNCVSIESVGEGVFEMRIHYGAGWRVYYAQEGCCVYLLLHAGNKAHQKKNILQAKALWRDIQYERKVSAKKEPQK